MNQTDKSYLWYLKYQPKTIDDYVFFDNTLRDNMKSWIETGNVPHLGFFGPPGTGKSTAIEVLINELIARGHVDRGDVVRYNMSDEGMDAVRDEITPLIQLVPFGKYRIVVLEEMEQMSTKSQASLKRIMEEYADNARFFLTSNAPHRILGPIRSRVQAYHIAKHDYESFMIKLINILLAENVALDEASGAIIDKYARATWPDFRSAINTLQAAVVNGKLTDVVTSSATAGYEYKIIDAIKNGTIRTARQEIVSSVADNQVDDFFSFLYRNVDLFSGDEVTKMKLIVAIRDGLVKSTMCADKELNLTATLIQLDMIVSSDFN